MDKWLHLKQMQAMRPSKVNRPFTLQTELRETWLNLEYGLEMVSTLYESFELSFPYPKTF